jgi:hypothetical protein
MLPTSGTTRQAPRQEPTQKPATDPVTPDPFPRDGSIPDDLIPSAQAAKLTGYGKTWSFVRYARDLGIREFERISSGRLFWSRAEVMARCFRQKPPAS